jgi:hypothetical protein
MQIVYGQKQYGTSVIEFYDTVREVIQNESTIKRVLIVAPDEDLTKIAVEFVNGVDVTRLQSFLSNGKVTILSPSEMPPSRGPDHRVLTIAAAPLLFIQDVIDIKLVF